MRDILAPTEPLDTDTGPRRSLPPVLLVGAGGVLGTAARSLLSTAIPDVAGVPVGILFINLTGAFLLGLLLEALARRGPDEGSRRDLRLLLGTGLIGGYTTCSTLATGTALLILDGYPFTGIGYALGTVVLGAGCSLLGIVTGRLVPERHEVSA